MPHEVGDKLPENKRDGRKRRSIFNLVHDCCSSLAHVCPYPCRSVLLYVHSAVRYERTYIHGAIVGNTTLPFDPSLLCFETFFNEASAAQYARFITSYRKDESFGRA